MRLVIFCSARSKWQKLSQKSGVSWRSKKLTNWGESRIVRILNGAMNYIRLHIIGTIRLTRVSLTSITVALSIYWHKHRQATSQISRCNSCLKNGKGSSMLVSVRTTSQIGRTRGTSIISTISLIHLLIGLPSASTSEMKLKRYYSPNYSLKSLLWNIMSDLLKLSFKNSNTNLSTFEHIYPTISLKLMI